jgi:hypothetical protein
MQTAESRQDNAIGHHLDKRTHWIVIFMHAHRRFTP